MALHTSQIDENIEIKLLLNFSINKGVHYTYYIVILYIYVTVKSQIQ